MEKPTLSGIFSILTEKIKTFFQSGQQNILRFAFTVLLGIVSALVTTFSIYQNIKSPNVLRCMFINFKLWIPILVSAIVFLVFTILIKANPDNFVERYQGRKDEHGVQMAKNGTYGTAAWMSKKDAYAILEVAHIKKANGVILGGFDPEGKETVCIPRGTKAIKEITNQNVCIFGSPGEGKSWGYARCNILQIIRRGESYIITDPKGELHHDTAKLALDNGYKVKLLNLADPQTSNAWNCAKACFNPVTGNVDPNRVNTFVDAIMKNTSDAKELHDYFANNERTLYAAVILYIAEKYTSDVREKIKEIVKGCDTNDNNHTLYDFNIMFSDPNDQINHMNKMRQVAKDIFVQYGPKAELIDNINMKLSAIATENGKTYEPISAAATPEERAKQFDSILDIKTASLTKPTLSNIYYKINNLKLLDFKKEVDDLHNSSAYCHTPLNTILQQGENVWNNFTNGCSVRLSVLNEKTLRLMVSEDDIDLSAPGREKCAYYCIFPDQDNTFQFISSLFFTFLFRDQIEYADTHGGNPVPINYILDEFANIGVIPDFSNKISTARSRNIGITMIVQAITQLYQIYTENITNTILACCSTMIFLGVNDDITVNYFVNKLGETTIVARSTRDERKIGRLDRLLPEYSESLGEGRRNLLTFDELRRINESDLIVVCAHLKPLLLKKITANYHPLSNNGHFEPTNLSDIRPFIERYAGCELRDEFAREQRKAVEEEIQHWQNVKNNQAANSIFEYKAEDDPLAGLNIKTDPATGEVVSMSCDMGEEKTQPITSVINKDDIPSWPINSDREAEDAARRNTPVPDKDRVIPEVKNASPMDILSATETHHQNTSSKFGTPKNLPLKSAKINSGKPTGRSSILPTTAKPHQKNTDPVVKSPEMDTQPVEKKESSVILEPDREPVEEQQPKPHNETTHNDGKEKVLTFIPQSEPENEEVIEFIPQEKPITQTFELADGE